MLPVPHSHSFLVVATAATVVVVSAAMLACSTPDVDSVPANTYLDATTEPCAPFAQSDIDPCERRLDDWDVRQTPYITPALRPLDGPPTMETVLSERYFRTPYLIPHLVVRGTVIPGSTRCREADREILAAYGEPPVVYEHPHDSCFSEIRVNEYIVGRGPSRLTLEVGSHHKVDSLFDDSTSYYQWLEDIHSVFEGSEWVIGLHVNIDFAFSVWKINDRPWDLQRKEDGTLVVVDWMARTRRRDRPSEENGFEVTLDEFRVLVQRMHRDYLTSNKGRIGDFEDAPLVVTDANYEFLHAHMSASPVFDIVDATPLAAPPPR